MIHTYIHTYIYKTKSYINYAHKKLPLSILVELIIFYTVLVQINIYVANMNAW